MRRIWIWVIVGAALLFVFAMPTLFSIQPFKQIVVRKVERKVGKTVTIDHVRFSWLGPQQMEGIHIVTSQINGVIEKISSNVPFWSIGSFTSGIEQINGSGTTTGGTLSGQFSVEATKLEGGEITFQFSSRQMPTSATLNLLKVNNSGALQTLIGPSFNASGSGSIKNDAGQFDLDFASPKTQTQIRASFTPVGFTLRAPLTLACYLTPELTQNLTNGALWIQSKTPTRLRIEPNGFFLPRPFSLANLCIERASLDLSKILVQHANLAPLASMLKADSLTASQIDMWLTSVDCTLEEGLFEMGRVDALLVDSIHLCAWGKANLLQNSLNMIFGIPADTLAKSLRIKNIPSSYVLQIPVTGTFRKPNIDTSSAGAKIAILIAGNQAQKQGGFLGGVGSVISKMSEERSPPPKRPFPWE